MSRRMVTADGAERVGEVGDAQHPVALQRLEQLGAAGDL